MGILSLLLWTPAVGALLLALTSGQKTLAIRWISNGVTGLTFSIVVFLTTIYDSHNPSAQFTEYYVLNSELGNAYALGVDGLSMPMLLLTGFLICIALLASKEITHRVKTFHICILLLEFGMLGVFLTLDWALFYVFWEATLIPLFFLIDRWGEKRRHSASLNFFLYTIGGSIFILVSLFAIGEYIPDMSGSLMSNFDQAAQTMPKDKQIWVLIGFLIGFGVKMPIFPLHGWLPLVLVEAPASIRILLSGILLKMGAYGLLRVLLMLPDAIQAIQPILLFMALFSMLYGALLAWRQTDLRALLAYASISHMGIIFLGIITGNLTGITGTVLQMTAHGLTAAALFFLTGLLYERTGTYNIQDYSSLAQVMPRFAVLTSLTLLAIMGLPGTVSFVAQLHTFIGGVQRWGGWMIFFSAGVLITAAYAIRTIGLLFTGPVKPQMQNIPDIHNIELLAASILVAAILILGFFPAPLMDLSMATLTQVSTLINSRAL